MVKEEVLGLVSGGQDLDMVTMADTIGQVMRGEWSDAEIAMLLTALRAKGETVEEIAGAAQAMRTAMTPISSRSERLVDTCGTGGDGSGTFNISTASALVAAAAGARVAKHGNRSISSKSGSADVLSQLGVNIDADVEQVSQCLEEVGICFCFAPSLHPAMKNVAKVRKQLGVRTIFNLLGPLCNPASAPFQLLGVGIPDLRETLASALALLGTERAVVVCGEDGLDEVTLEGATNVNLVSAGEVSQFQWTPEEFGMDRQSKDAMVVDGPEASAAVIRSVLDGQPGPCLDIVILNAAAAIWTAEIESDPKAAAARCREAVDSGAAREVLGKLAEYSHQG